jgi:hypothetical protein
VKYDILPASGSSLRSLCAFDSKFPLHFSANTHRNDVRFVAWPPDTAEPRSVSQQWDRMEVAWDQQADRALGGSQYTRHQPEQTLLYQIIDDNYPDFVGRFEPEGRALPRFVRREFEDYLKCGRLEHGFLRVHCTDCHAEKLVAFSCKRRGFCHKDLQRSRFIPTGNVLRPRDSLPCAVNTCAVEAPWFFLWPMTFSVPLSRFTLMKGRISRNAPLPECWTFLFV